MVEGVAVTIPAQLVCEVISRLLVISTSDVSKVPVSFHRGRQVQGKGSQRIIVSGRKRFQIQCGLSPSFGYKDNNCFFLFP